MTKAEIIEQEEIRYEEFYEQYQGDSLASLVERRDELERTVGSDLVELRAIKDVIATMECDMNIFSE